MSNAGFEDVRQTIAESLNRRFDTKFSAKNLIMTVGAASGLNVILKTILNPGEEVIVFAPYFLEYGAYVRNYDGVLVEISPDTTTFQPNLAEFEQKITPKTRAVIVNTPHNPTGVVYSEETIKKLSAILEAKQKEFGTVIYLISDEPYRELAYDGVEVPYLPIFIISYKIRLGVYTFCNYLLDQGRCIYTAKCTVCNGCCRDQLFASVCLIRDHQISDTFTRKGKRFAVGIAHNSIVIIFRQALYNGLKECGFECIKPQGAFYLFVMIVYFKPYSAASFLNSGREFTIVS